ncbi:unnamed protein product, partial [Schistosoma turkestanicum]
TNNMITFQSKSDVVNSNSLTISIKSSKSLSVKSTNKKNQIQSNMKLKSDVDHLTSVKSMPNSSLLGFDTSSTSINQQLCRLPSRNSFFKDSVIS